MRRRQIGPVQQLDALRRDLARKHDRQHLSWREIARRYFPAVPPGTLCAVAKGREPKKIAVRLALGLPAVADAPVCPDCGQVHVAETCTASKPRGANGARPVTVWAHRVRSGAVVLGRSRRCGRRRCGIHFVGPGKYCSDDCRARARASQRKRRRMKMQRGRKARR